MCHVLTNVELLLLYDDGTDDPQVATFCTEGCIAAPRTVLRCGVMLRLVARAIVCASLLVWFSAPLCGCYVAAREID